MKIGVVSDTHSRELPRQMIEEFAKVDLIIHAGDFCSLDILTRLKRIKQVNAVFGNMDEVEIRRIFPKRQILEIDSSSIGLFHGEGSPKTILEVIRNEFKGRQKLDAIIFGHSHQPLSEKLGNVLYFNPGSPNDTIFAPYRSYGILETTPQGLNGKIIRVKE